MRAFIKFILAVLFIVLIMTISFREKKTAWKGTIEEEYGVTVVKNPKKPIHDDAVFSLKEDLALGEKGIALSIPYQKELCWTLDSSGNVYIGESQAYEILVFSPLGKQIRRIEKEYEQSKVLEPDIENYVNEQFQFDKKRENILVDDHKARAKSARA